MPEITFARRADVLANDLAAFVESIYLATGLHDKTPVGWVERDILEFIQHGPQNSLVLAPRGFGKSHFVTAAVTLWDLYRDHEAKVLIVSKSSTFARKLISLIRGWIRTIPFLQHLDPARRPAGLQPARDQTSQFDVGPSSVSKDPSVFATGIEGQLPGTRASRIIYDDIETPDNTKTVEARQELEDKLKEFTAIATYGEQRKTGVGTYHHAHSVYLAQHRKGHTLRAWPELYPTSDQCDRIVGLAPSIQQRLDAGAEPGDIVADYRVTRDFVAERQAEGTTWYGMQCMLIADYGDVTRYPLRLVNFIVHPCERNDAPISLTWGKHTHNGESTAIQDIPSLGFGGDRLHRPYQFSVERDAYTGTKAWIDPAGKAGKRNDRSGLAVVGHLAGFLHAKCITALPGGFDTDTLRTIAQTCRHHNVQEIHVEDFALQAMFAQLLIPIVQQESRPRGDDAFPDGWTASVIATRPPAAQKEIRIIQALEPIMGNHRLVIDPKAIANEQLQRQLTSITRERNCLDHEDELEALANCVWLWQHTLRLDPEHASEQAQQRRINNQLEQARQEARGNRGVHVGWGKPKAKRVFQHR